MKALPVHQAREKEQVMGKSKGGNQPKPTEEMRRKKSSVLINQITYIERVKLQKWHQKK